MRLFKRKKKKEQPQDPAPAAADTPQDQTPPESAETTTPPSEEPPAPAEDTSPDEAPDEPQAESPKRGWLARLSGRLARTREKIGGTIDRIARGRKIDEEVLEELEEALVTADLGVTTAMELIDDMRRRVKRRELDDAEALKRALAQQVAAILAEHPYQPPHEHTPHVIMVVGVNGVGKTTTIGKLAWRFQNQGRRVLLAAGDTFRAAAAEQLEVWARRAGCELVRQQPGADPSAVAYDALEAAVSRGCQVVIIDTAGRLQTNVNLMEELKKVHRVVGKKLPGAPHEVLLVVDATTGQNAVSQAKLFHQAVPLTGIILTKLDGTAKGGVVVAIARELGLPIAYLGLGEGLDDLRPFDPEQFAAALF